MASPGATVFAGGTATPDVTQFTVAADVGSESYSIGSSPRAPYTIRDVCTVTIAGPDDPCDEISTIDGECHGDILGHADGNCLQRVVG